MYKHGEKKQNTSDKNILKAAIKVQLTDEFHKQLQEINSYKV